VTHIFQKPLDNGYHRICVISINTLGLLDKSGTYRGNSPSANISSVVKEQTYRET
jgi:hypothetical protein